MARIKKETELNKKCNLTIFGIDINNISKDDFIVIRIDPPEEGVSIPEDFIEWLYELCENDFFGDAKVMVIPKGVEITVENITNLFPVTK